MAGGEWRGVGRAGEDEANEVQRSLWNVVWRDPEMLCGWWGEGACGEEAEYRRWRRGYF